MNDLTLVYYSANAINPWFAENVRAHLVTTAWDYPIISVTQGPVGFGRNVDVGPLGQSVYNVYWQILLGARLARTPYIACCEDDTLYSRGHLAYRPPPEMFAYNGQRWHLDPPVTGDDGAPPEKWRPARFRLRHRCGMCACVVRTDYLLETLERRFAAYPRTGAETRLMHGWGEPGKFDHIVLKLPRVHRQFFETPDSPVVTFNHPDSLQGLRKRNMTDRLAWELPIFGRAHDLWERMYAGSEAYSVRRAAPVGGRLEAERESEHPYPPGADSPAGDIGIGAGGSRESTGGAGLSAPVWG